LRYSFLFLFFKPFSYYEQASYKEDKEKPTGGECVSNKGCLHSYMQDRFGGGMCQGVQVSSRAQVEVRLCYPRVQDSPRSGGWRMDTGAAHTAAGFPRGYREIQYGHAYGLARVPYNANRFVPYSNRKFA